MIGPTISDMPDEARLFVFASSRALETGEVDALLRAVDGVLSTWRSHGRPVRAARELRHERFLLVAADESMTALSGCSVDGLVREMKALAGDLGISLLDPGSIDFRETGGIRRVTRAEFAALVRSGAVGPDTVVFNHTVATVGEVRAGRWETALRRSWHARAFPVPGEGDPGAAGMSPRESPA